MAANPHQDVSVQDGYVLAENETPETGEHAARILAEIDARLAETGLQAVMLDSTRVSGQSDEVREVLWAWIQAARLHRKVAILVKSEMIRVQGNMTALSKGARLKSFNSKADAEAWLRR